MFYFVFAVHLILCVALIGLVLLQQGKGAEMGPAFGAGGANTLFGASGATSLVVKLTTGACILFMVTSVALIKLYSTQTPGPAVSVDSLESALGAGSEAPVNEAAGPVQSESTEGAASSAALETSQSGVEIEVESVPAADVPPVPAPAAQPAPPAVQ